MIPTLDRIPLKDGSTVVGPAKDIRVKHASGLGVKVSCEITALYIFPILLSWAFSRSLDFFPFSASASTSSSPFRIRIITSWNLGLHISYIPLHVAWYQCYTCVVSFLAWREIIFARPYMLVSWPSKRSRSVFVTDATAARFMTV